MNSSVSEKYNGETPLWMYLCDKMNKSENSTTKIRQHAKEMGISIKGKSRRELCKELSKYYQSNLENTGDKNEEDDTSSSSSSLSLQTGQKDVKSLKVKLAKLIDNLEGGYRNFFEPQDIDNWNEGKTSYEYHEILYNVKNLDDVEKNKKRLGELYSFDRFPTFPRLLRLLIYTIENVPISDRQELVLSLKAIFMEDPYSEDDEFQRQEEQKIFEYDYENEYGVRR